METHGQAIGYWKRDRTFANLGFGAPGGFRVRSSCTCRSAPAEAKETPKFAKDRVVKDFYAEFQECRDHVMGG